MVSSLLERVKQQRPKTADTFIAEAEAVTPAPVAVAAEQGTVITIEPDAPAPAARRPRQAGKDDARKFEVPRYTFNLRLNDYELELLRSLADGRRESMQKIVKAGLIPYLEGLRGKIKQPTE